MFLLYVLAFLFLVVVGLFAYVWNKNVYKSTIGSLATALGGFAIGSTFKNPEMRVIGNGENLISWLNISVDYLTFTSTPTPVVITLIITIALALCTFGALNLLDSIDQRRSTREMAPRA